MNITKLYELIVENTAEIGRLTAKFGPESAKLNEFYFKTLRKKYTGGQFIKDVNEVLRRFNTLQEWEAFLKPWLDREGYYDAKQKAKNFTELYNSLSDKDMYSYDFVVNKDAQPENIKRILENEMSYDIIYNDNTWLVVTPFQPNLDVVNEPARNASKFFSKMKNIEKGATWCVGWNSTSNYFGSYTKNYGPHYIIIKKGQTKYNIQLGGGAGDNNKQDTGNVNLREGAYDVFPPIIFNRIFQYAQNKGFDVVKGKNLIPNFINVLNERRYAHAAELTRPVDSNEQFFNCIIDNDIEKFKTLLKTNDVNKLYMNERIQSNLQLPTRNFTPLTLAFIYGRKEIIQHLLVQPNININNEYIDTLTPLAHILTAYFYGKTVLSVTEETTKLNLDLILNSDKANLNKIIFDGQRGNILYWIISTWINTSNTARFEESIARKLYIVNKIKDKINLNNMIIDGTSLLIYLNRRNLTDLYNIFSEFPSLDINQKDNELNTLFSTLIVYGKKEQLKKLLENKTKKVDITGYKWILRLVDDAEIKAMVEAYAAAK